MAQFNHKKQFIIRSALLLTFPFILWSCAETLPPGDGTTSSFSDFKYASADAETGGKLYDKWWTEKSMISPPTYDNPVWRFRAKDSNGEPYNNNNSSQWRCKECHGWDYKGQTGAYSLVNNPDKYTGVNGVNNSLNPDYTKEVIFNVISNGAVDLNGQENIPHSFLADDKLDEDDIYDLTKFIFEYAINGQASPFGGDATAGKIVFETTNLTRTSCDSSGCHANNMDDIINVAQTNPQEFMHKVQFGQPGEFMPGGLSVQQARDVRAYVEAGASSDLPSSDFNATTYAAQGQTDVNKGGLLYDKWWKVTTNATEPTTEHPLWANTNNSLVTGSDTWRCKECHGWDYRGKDGAYSSGKHFTGFAGIVSTASATMTMLTADNVFSYLKTDTTHGFANGFFTDEEYYDLTRFIMEMRTEVLAQSSGFNFIDDSTKLAVGADNTNGKTLYEGAASCGSAACHDVDGKRIDFGGGEYVHTIAQDNPWEFIHKIRFGDGNVMPGLNDKAANVNTIQAAADILGYAQTSLAPNIKRAGLLYDKWWNTDGVKNSVEPSSVRNPIWVAQPLATTDATKVSNSATWRCKECHGWDYLGVSGAYGDTTSKHYSGITGFKFSTNKAKETLTDIILNGNANGNCGACDINGDNSGHAFSTYLSDEDAGLLADFIKNIASETDYNAAINSTDTANGSILYKSDSPGHCEGCHGEDGTSTPGVEVADVANSNAQEFIHKSRYGHPGSTMVPPTLGFLGLSLGEAGDVLAYSKTLAATPPPNGNPSYDSASMNRGGRLYDKWWAEMQSTDNTIQKPSNVNPFYAEGVTKGTLPALAAGSEDKSWRCKTCHAWNYKGVGYYTGTSSDSGADNLLYKIDLRRSAFGNVEASVQQHFFDWIKTGYGVTTHQFGVQTPDNPTPMTDQEIWDTVKFILEGLINTDTYILSSGVVIGTDNANGDGLYNGAVSNDVNCSLCHGIDGDTPPTPAQGGSGDPLDIFAIAAANDNPWEYVHKVRYGQPNTPMPATTGIPGLTVQDAYDILGYAQQRFNERQSIP